MQVEKAPVHGPSGSPEGLLDVLRAAESGLGSAPRASTVRGGLAQWTEVVGATQRVMNLAAALQDEAIVALAAIEVEELDDGHVVHTHRAPGHIALDAPAIVSGVLPVSAVHAERRVRSAVRLASEGPSGTDTDAGLGGLHEAMRRGELDAYRAGVVAEELEMAPPPVAAAVVEALGGHLVTDAAPRLRRRCRTLLSRVSPDLVRRRATQARERCGLRRWAEEPGVDRWEGTFRSEDAARAWAAIDARAHELVAEGTCQRIEGARSRALIDLVTGSATIETIVTITVPASPGDSGRGGAAARADSTRPQGGSDGDPAADVACSRSAPSSGSPDDLVEVSMGARGEPVLVTRAFLDVDTSALGTRVVERACHRRSGALLDHTSSDSYRPPAALAALIRQRDGRCRFPGCHVSARFCDLDHVRPWPAGPTTASNLICLCRRHHRVKQRLGWRVRLHPDATLSWTDPTGLTRGTYPVDALSSLVLPAARHAASRVDAAHPVTPDAAAHLNAPDATDATDAHPTRCGTTDPFSATEFALDHALAALTRADHDRRAALHRVPRPRQERLADGVSTPSRLRFDVRHHLAHQDGTRPVVVAETWGGGPAHRTTRRRSGHGGESGDPPF